MCWEDPNPTIYICEVEFLVDVETINDVLGVSEVSNVEFNSQLRGMDWQWLRDTLFKEEFRGQVYWPTTEGITRLYFSIDDRRWLTLVARRIHPSGNFTYVTYPRALVVAYAIKGIRMKVWAQIQSE